MNCITLTNYALKSKATEAIGKYVSVAKQYTIQVNKTHSPSSSSPLPLPPPPQKKTLENSFSENLFQLISIHWNNLQKIYQRFLFFSFRF